jgi:SAM-dependent methyltransferase
MPETSSNWARIRVATRTRGLRDDLRLRQRWFGSPFAAVEPYVPREGDVLDLGCGFGVLGAWLALTRPARRVVGLDVDEAKIARGRAWYGHLPNLALSHADLAATPLPASDAIVIYDVLHHLPDADATLAAAARALRPGGVLVVKENDVTPAWKHAVSLGVERVAVGSGLTRSAPVRFRTRDAWVRAIEATGLRVIHATHLTAREGFFVPHSLFVAVRGDD